ncbi:MAG: aminotransferase class I/II-fold pyridoxal phosphate-dependent enzyme, partial [Verrucomicrobiota bacterium]
LNLFGGEASRGFRHILLPQMPEYIGYANQGLHEDLFLAIPGKVKETGSHRFKYLLDRERIQQAADQHLLGAICVSRPCNPSSNVLQREEIDWLGDLAKAKDIPFLIDSAYGVPFPGVIYEDRIPPRWTPQTIITLSLSKLGLPGTRTGMVIASEEIVERIAAMTAITGLANTNLGQALVRPLLEDGSLAQHCEQSIVPFYRQRCQETVDLLDETLKGLPYRLHEPEGAFFLWLRFEGLPITTRELYDRLKRQGLLVVPGEPFFFGANHLDPSSVKHGQECIRLSYTQSPERIAAGIQILNKTVRPLFQSN